MGQTLVAWLRQMSILVYQQKQPTELEHIITQRQVCLYQSNLLCILCLKKKLQHVGLLVDINSRIIQQEKKNLERCILKERLALASEIRFRNQDWAALSRLFAASFIFPTKS